ncbi:MAG: PQQ-binding-like beta-propeller repeat protein [Kofleriaceae bacterium]
MRAIAVTCPTCGATLSVPSGTVSVACQYCGRPARIQERSRVWQVPRPLAAPGPAQPTPVARQRVSPLVLLLICGAVLGSFGAGLYVVVALTAPAPSLAEGPPPPAVQAPAAVVAAMSWGGLVPVPVDVDGDGRAELVGFIRYTSDGDRVKLAALSTVDGRVAWATDWLGTYSDLIQTTLAARGDLILHTTSAGEVRAYDRATGAARWTAALGEKIELVCAGPGPAEVVVGLADDTWVALDGAGATRAATPLLRLDRPPRRRQAAQAAFAAAGVEAPAGLCVRLDNRGFTRPVGVLSIDSWVGLPRVAGMAVQLLVRNPGGPAVAVGHRAKGSPVPMLARIEGDRAAWTVEVPTADPLNARADEDDVALGADYAAQFYQRGSNQPSAVAAFALADGARRWTVDLPLRTSVTGLRAVGDLVVVTTSFSLIGLDAATGAQRFRVGEF